MIVDYHQLLGGSNRRAQDGRVQEVSEITTGFVPKEAIVAVVLGGSIPLGIGTKSSDVDLTIIVSELTAVSKRLDAGAAVVVR